MPFQAPYELIDIPKTNILLYLFPNAEEASLEPLWISPETPEESVSAAELLQWVKRLGSGFDKVGIKEGEVVVVFSPSHIFQPVVYLAVVVTGRVFSGANPGFTTAELAYQLKDSNARLLLSHPSLLNTALEAAAQAKMPRDSVLLFSEKKCAPIKGISDWQNILDRKTDAEEYEWKRMDGDEATRTIAAINYSSGTTGLPKGVCISHHNLVASVAQTIHVMRRDETFNPASERFLSM
ncbi:MAG: hypothetical protein Q9169_007555 [Polycauliona sp. 2 TL-2023]